MDAVLEIGETSFIYVQAGVVEDRVVDDVVYGNQLATSIESGGVVFGARAVFSLEVVPDFFSFSFG